MQNRTRTRTKYSASGSVRYSGTDYGPFNVLISSGYINDFIKKTKRLRDHLTPPSNLEMRNQDIFSPPEWSFTERAFGEFTTAKFDKVPCENIGSVFLGPSAGWQSLEDTADEYIVRLLANTNPFRYTISVPVMMAELVEGATLLKVSMNSWISLFGSAHLNKTFGWDTMIQDIRTLANITKHIENRVLEFNRLIEHGSLRRKVQLSSSSVSEQIASNTPIFSGYQKVLYGDAHATFTSKVWGTVRWRPRRTDFLPVDKLSIFNLAVQTVLDLGELTPDTIWEAIPFSWLVDYFIDIGDSLKAIEASDVVEPYDICIMRERTSRVRTVPIRPSWFDASGGIFTYEGTDISPGVAEYRQRIRNVYESERTHLLNFGFMNPKQAINVIALLASLKR